MISKEKKAEIIANYGRKAGDTGSPEVQIAGLAMMAAGKVLGKADAAEQNKLMYEQFLAKTGGCNDTDSK